MRVWVLSLIALISISLAIAQVELRKEDEKIYYNGTICRPSRYCCYTKVLIREPSGKYVLKPYYISDFSKWHGKCDNGYRLFKVKGEINTKNLIDGEYSLVFNLASYASNSIYSYKFQIGNLSKWKYSFHYSPGWKELDFDDSKWKEGEMPFGNPSHFPIKTPWRTYSIYLRKEIYLEDYLQANLKMFAENFVKCYVNGKHVASHQSLHALNNINCYRDSISFEYEGKTVFVLGDREYNGILFVDISKYLKPGKNVIACYARIFDEVYKRCMYWPRCWEYPGRQFVDVEFLPLQENEVFWSHARLKNWYEPTHKFSRYYEYSCKRVGGRVKTYRYVKAKMWHGPWQWNRLDITDDTTFYIKPEHFEFRSDKIYWGVSPFNGKVTYFRRWIYSNESKFLNLKISTNGYPYCYLNGNKIELRKYNHEYWNHYSKIELKEGTNLIACKVVPNGFTLFDLTTSGFSGKLKITNLSARISDGLRLKVQLENTSHPETNVLVIADLKNGNETFSKQIVINSANTSESIKYGIINLTYKQWKEDSNWHRCNGCIASYRAFDGKWDTCALIRHRPKKIEERYVLDNGVYPAKIIWKYKISDAKTSEVYLFNYKNNSFDLVYKGKNGAYVLIDPQYLSKNGKVHILVNLTPRTPWVAGKYYEGALYVEGYKLTKSKYLKINSNASAEIFFRIKPGRYNLTVSAIDLIDGDIDIYETELSFGAGAAEKVGFLPLRGDAKGWKLTRSGGTVAVLAAATSAIASVLYITKKPSYLKRLKVSSNKIENLIKRLRKYQYYSNIRNRNLFSKILNQKYNIFKYHMYLRKKEEERVEEIRKIIEMQRKMRLMKLIAQSEILVSSFLSEIMYLRGMEKVKAIDEFIRKNKGNLWEEHVSLLWKERAIAKEEEELIKKQKSKKQNKEDKSKTTQEIPEQPSTNEFSLIGFIKDAFFKVDPVKVGIGIGVGIGITIGLMALSAIFPPVGIAVLGLGIIGGGIFAYSVGKRIGKMRNEIIEGDMEEATEIAASLMEDGFILAGTAAASYCVFKFPFPKTSAKFISKSKMFEVKKGSLEKYMLKGYRKFSIDKGNIRMDYFFDSYGRTYGPVISVKTKNKDLIALLSKKEGGIPKLLALKELGNSEIYFEKYTLGEGSSRFIDKTVILNKGLSSPNAALEEGVHLFQQKAYYYLDKLFGKKTVTSYLDILGKSAKPYYGIYTREFGYPNEAIPIEYQADIISNLWGGSKIDKGLDWKIPTILGGTTAAGEED